MVQIVQFDYAELQIVVKNCLIDAIQEIRSIPTPEEISDRCTLPEACEITGLSRSLIYKLSMDGEIPRLKYGRRLVFSRKALNEWVTARTVLIASSDNVMSDRLQKTAKKRV